MKEETLDLVLPCYNPPANWDRNVIASIEKIRAMIPGTRLNLILVNDGSVKGISDREISILKEEIPGLFYIALLSNTGKGHALRAGVRESKGDFCVYTDIDFPYREEDLVKVFRALQHTSGDVAAGVRDDQYYQNVPPFRVMISRFLKFLIKSLLKLEITDTQCGLKGFNSRGKELFLQTQTDRYLFDLEFIMKSSRDPSITLNPVPVKLKPDIVFSRMNPKVLLVESLNFLRLMFRF